ncbi:hypothetical protein GCM10007301_30690 [Azorhizobium oxalatiphilum]|uniref:DUF2478 domain-containing protein n=1 Tax=Azorhizobium oxalatiphilum TaxID=980631 RepID=A0A917C3E7_9HYPH|nr:DUF2478 domain-containing protein [Azorhizobium oxalatiphilum]GGF68878.1 hypothetical protein GCM10007301_30690 [Azorhizobium oxalatiphilum]
MGDADGDFGLGAVICTAEVDCDALLEGVARHLHARGHDVAAYVHRHASDDDACCDSIAVEEIFSGLRWLITQSLGSGSQACRLDPHGLADVAAHAMEALDRGPDLVILNRFGKSEAEGQGMRDVLARGCAAGIPMLTVLKQEHLGAWDAFTDGMAQVIPAHPEAVLGWCDRVMAPRGGVRAASQT